MNEFGHYSLFLCWLLSLVAVVAGSFAGLKARSDPGLGARWTKFTVRSAIMAGVMGGLSLFALGWMFHFDDYTNQYVWQYSNRDMSPVYKVSAIWGGMDGSMLLWGVMVVLCGTIVAVRAHQYPRALVPWVIAVISSSALFFLSIVFFLTNPFRYLNATFIPPDGNGLNPLLQNPFMAIHPPTLYVGFTAHVVPFGFCLAALLSGQLTNEWIRLTRRWALVAWTFLTAGIVLGGYWAYIELGWGGFWAWDPVENSSFLPWLTSTAFIHSVMVQERKNMLRMWNVWLMVVTYLLTVFGTFLTRSGIVQSVHAFASTDVGWVFLAYLGTMLVFTVVLTIWRRKELASERKIESFWSREAFFLLNNLVLLSIGFATLWGVMFPVLSEALTGQKQAVGIPYFNAVNVPLFLLLIFLMGVGPLIAWKRASLVNVKRSFLFPFVSAFAVCVLLVIVGINEFYPVLAYGLCWFVLMTILGELHRGVKSQRIAKAEVAGEGQGYGGGLLMLLRRHRTRYGGYLVHVGVVVVTIGITSSMAYKVEQEFTLAKGETTDLRRFSLTLDDIEGRQTPNYQALHAVVSVKDRYSGESLGVLEPELRSYHRNRESTTEVTILKSWKDDLYLVVAGLDESGSKASLKAYINPLQSWLWVGVFLMLAGCIVVILPRAIGEESLATQPDSSASGALRVRGSV